MDVCKFLIYKQNEKPSDFENVPAIYLRATGHEMTIKSDVTRQARKNQVGLFLFVTSLLKNFNVLAVTFFDISCIGHCGGYSAKLSNAFNKVFLSTIYNFLNFQMA